MTYLYVLDRPVQVSYLTPSYSGNPTTGNYLTLTVGGVNQINVSGSGTTTIVLPSGNYFVRCNIGGTKTGAASDLSYQLELDGSLIGNEAGYDTSTPNRVSTQYSEGVFEINANANLRVKINYNSGTNSILTNYSGMIIKRLA